MPVLCGEGPRAFYGLQEEIAKTTIDTGLFAWGPCAPLERLTDFGVLEMSPAVTAAMRAPMPFDAECYLLAPGPVAWTGSSGHIRFERPPAYPIIKLILSVPTSPGCGPTLVTVHIAILFCTLHTLPLGLPLIPCDWPGPRAEVGCPLFRCLGGPFRLVTISPEEQRRLKARWTTIWVVAKPPVFAPTQHPQLQRRSSSATLGSGLQRAEEAAAAMEVALAAASGSGRGVMRAMRPTSMLASKWRLAGMNASTCAPFRVPDAVLDGLTFREGGGTVPGRAYFRCVAATWVGVGWTGKPAVTLVFRTDVYCVPHRSRAGAVGVGVSYLVVTLGCAGAGQKEAGEQARQWRKARREVPR
ncbi:uncharacterized protein BXZ73DRAFT_83545 [Epithele typhae]|uniref:uncharacterized protein n=1 Tax=Epithele typhae TaxID=378194 RepID=UPI0020083355|nr:uncharacterized protein BXZ73DRAFT_83545 [Epithele typhae]KAH9910463.1 hypothetical protein BXZ73DRAFT_83545 [Epithele typhae]